MKKMMFNDKYGLTKAVLDGRKTMTRRIAKAWTRPDGTLSGWMPSKFKVGEVVAIAQNYNEVFDEFAEIVYIQNKPTPDNFMAFARQSDVTLPKALIGWNNKMFVKADLMPHHVRITNVRVERLQDISDEDCRKEGIYKLQSTHGDGKIGYFFPNSQKPYNTPREAYAALIDRVCRKGTCAKNPWVFVYEFELVR